MEPRWQVLDQQGERSTDGHVVDEVEVVDDHERRRAILEHPVIQQLVDDLDAVTERPQPDGRGLPEAVHERLDDGDEIRPELAGVLVRLVQGQPCDVTRALGRPPGEQRRLPRAGRGHHQGERSDGHLVEQLEEAVAADMVLGYQRSSHLAVTAPAVREVRSAGKSMGEHSSSSLSPRYGAAVRPQPKRLFLRRGTTSDAGPAAATLHRLFGEPYIGCSPTIRQTVPRRMRGLSTLSRVVLPHPGGRHRTRHMASVQRGMGGERAAEFVAPELAAVPMGA